MVMFVEVSASQADAKAQGVLSRPTLMGTGRWFLAGTLASPLAKAQPTTSRMDHADGPLRLLCLHCIVMVYTPSQKKKVMVYTPFYLFGV